MGERGAEDSRKPRVVSVLLTQLVPPGSFVGEGPWASAEAAATRETAQSPRKDMLPKLKAVITTLIYTKNYLYVITKILIAHSAVCLN